VLNRLLFDSTFYHVTLKCYVGHRIKKTQVYPANYCREANFYSSAVDDALKNRQCHPSIGILLCRDIKNNLEVGFLLRGMSHHGVSEFNAY